MSSEAPQYPTDALVNAVDKLFDAVIDDPLLKLYFFDTDMSRLKKSFGIYLTCLLIDQENKYPGRGILSAHEGRNITDEAAAIFSQRLLKALSESGVPPSDVEKIRGKLPALENLVVDKFVSPDTHVYIPQRMK